MSKLAVEVHEGPAALDALAGPWRALFARADAAPFLSHEWTASFARTLLGGRTPHLLAVRRGAELVGLLPLASERVRPYGLPAQVRRLSFLVERFTGADDLDVLAAPGHELDVGAALAGHLATAGGFDVLDLDGLPAGSPTLGHLAHRLAGEAGLALSVQPRHVCPSVALEGTWQELLRRSSRGDNFRRRLKQLRPIAGFERRVITAASGAGAAFERFLGLHEARWAMQGGSDAMGRPAVQAFHREVVPRLAEAGALRFEELWVEGACRASIYGIDRGRTFAFYQAGYDPTWAQRSVGLVALGLSIEDAVGRGRKVYDFLRGTEPYKFDWATTVRNTVAIRVVRRGAESALLLAREASEGAVRRAAHALLPEKAIDSLRRLRRARERGA